MTLRALLLIAGLNCVALPEGAAAKDTVRDSVVRITANQRPPNFVQPWTKAGPTEMSGSGFVIAGNRILTSAHVVQYASQIYVEGRKSDKKIPASLAVLAPGIDLALLTVDDEEFFATRPALPLASGLPPAKGSVSVYGFPLDEKDLSIAKGVISRVDYAPFFYSTGGVRAQIDTALNPGHSGGPALCEGRVIGVAFSGLRAADESGYLIGAEEVGLFLEDAADGTYDGKPNFPDHLQLADNDALRAKLRLPASVLGVMVTSTLDESESYPLRAGDIITHIGESPLDSAATISVADDLRLPFGYLLAHCCKNGKVPLTIFRGDQSQEIELPVKPRQPPLLPYLLNTYPRYFIFGPLVFSSATKDFVIFLNRNFHGALFEQGSPMMRRYHESQAFEGEELVVVCSPMFPHAITKSYGQPAGAVVRQVNGVSVRNLVHLIELLRDGNNEFLEFKFGGRGYNTLVFRREEMALATEEILVENGIRNQYSDDLKDAWSGGE